MRDWPWWKVIVSGAAFWWVLVFLLSLIIDSCSSVEPEGTTWKMSPAETTIIWEDLDDPPAVPIEREPIKIYLPCDTIDSTEWPITISKFDRAVEIWGCQR